MVLMGERAKTLSVREIDSRHLRGGDYARRVLQAGISISGNDGSARAKFCTPGNRFTAFTEPRAITLPESGNPFTTLSGSRTKSLLIREIDSRHLRE